MFKLCHDSVSGPTKRALCLASLAERTAGRWEFWRHLKQFSTHQPFSNRTAERCPPQRQYPYRMLRERKPLAAISITRMWKYQS
jgi:hypothetical protein